MTENKVQGSYTPQPLVTADVPLPPELDSLLEQLAAHVHDVWAEQRFSEGWRFGPTRNDELKTHPCLVDYESLPESEKEYDRSTASETLRAIILLGYQIEQR